jgi:hypothetical protein
MNSVRADEVHLRDRITIKDSDGEWVTGKVIELALFGEQYETISITILTDFPRLVRDHFVPDHLITCERGTEDPATVRTREHAREQARNALLKNSAHVPIDPTHDPH